MKQQIADTFMEIRSRIEELNKWGVPAVKIDRLVRAATALEKLLVEEPKSAPVPTVAPTSPIRRRANQRVSLGKKK